MKKRLVVGNWKMYVTDADQAREFALGLRKRVRGLTGIDVRIAPPFPFLAELADVFASSPVAVGAQALSPYADAPHTGDVSGEMLKSVGVSFAIVGHSERRLSPQAGISGETNDMVRVSLERAAASGLAPILCVGEREREADGEHFVFIEAQLSSALKNIPKSALRKLVIAYEPVWAIGKQASDAMKPADVREMLIFIRKVLADVLDRSTALKLPILYGGSVEPDNAPALLAEGGVSGFLVGHASTKLDDFLSILRSCR